MLLQFVGPPIRDRSLLSAVLQSTRSSAVFLLLISLWWAASARADETATSSATRPRIGLVLSGGGARGAAHVGVLKVLDELHIPIDAIAGTSMGAVVGGLYASGMPAADIEKLMTSLDWQDAFRDRSPRAALGFRRKQDDNNFLVRYALGVSRGNFKLPTGLVQGQKLTQVLRSATLPVADVSDFNRLPIPFRAIATDLESGQEVVLNQGDLVTAMRASMSAPAVFTPIERNGRLLVDGGLVNNLPVDIARQMNVDVLIVVDVSSPLFSEQELTSPLAVTNQSIAIMVRRHTLEQRATLGSRDIVVEPSLGSMTSSEFGRMSQALRSGEEAARGLRERLAALALDDTAYQDYLAARESHQAAPPKIAFIETDASSLRYSRAVDAFVGNLQGHTLDRSELNDDLSRLYALDLFESIDYNLVQRDGETGLDLHLKRKSWGPNYVRVGINLEDDFAGNSRYNAAARLIMTELNSLGAEWLTDLQIGDQPKFATEFYQPLSVSNRYFVVPHGEIGSRSLQVLDNNHRIAEYRVRSSLLGLDVGKELSSWGEIRIGIQRGDGTSSVLIGDPTLPSEHYNSGGYFGRFSYDTLDNVFFPRHGQQFTLQFNTERSALGADRDYNKASAQWLLANTIGRYTIAVSAGWGSTLNANAAPHDYFTLGGFLNLSGLPTDSLSGPHYGIARMMFYRQIGKGGTGVLELPAYAGISIEAGNTWQNRSDISFSSLHHDGSLFFGADTPLGPLYLAAGVDDRSKTAFYLFLGRSF
jgi:NTE family protein